MDNGTDIFVYLFVGMVLGVLMSSMVIGSLI